MSVVNWLVALATSWGTQSGAAYHLRTLPPTTVSSNPSPSRSASALQSPECDASTISGTNAIVVAPGAGMAAPSTAATASAVDVR